MQVQCERIICTKGPTNTMANRESIHSGHFMVSHFEAEAQDDDEIASAVEVPEPVGQVSPNYEGVIACENSPPPLNIENSLTKLFQCMSLAYRQKLTSPKWNRFKGIRLRWKDKIRLNNVIWRCWHMQFIMKQNTLVCQFASPLDVDTHNKPEAVVLEGKYWKRKLAAVTAEYKKWRMFYRNRTFGYGSRDASDVLSEIDFMDWTMGSTPMHMLDDNDYMQFMSDTLFSTISNQPYAFPDSREIARGANIADFIQPSLGPLQPNLEDFMDTLEPLQDLLGSRLPSVPEESNEDVFRPNIPAITAEQQENNYNMGIGSTMLNTMQTYNQNYTPVDTQLEQYNMQIFEAPSHVGPITRGGRTRTRSLMNSNPGRNRDIYSSMPYQGYTVMNVSQPNAMTNQNNLQQNPVHYLNNALNVNMQNNVPLTNPGQQINNIQTNISNQNLPNNMSMTNNITNLQNNIPNNMMSMTNNLTNQQTLSTSLTNLHHVPPNITNIPILTKNRSLGNMSNLIPQNLQNPMSNIQSNIIVQQPQKLSPQQPFRTPSPQQTYKMSPRVYTDQNVTGIRKHATKEMFRSNSLPLNGTLQLEDGTFLAPRAGRGRGTKANFKPPPLNSAVSDPALNKNSALLAQLLTNTNGQNASTFLTNTSSTNNQATIVVTPISLSPQTQILLPPSPVSVPSPPNVSVSPPPSKISKGPHRETRRAGHIHAEQKRRYNIKNGFDTLHSLIPQLHQNPTAKLSKAAMLQKGAEYIKQLQFERRNIEEELKSLRLQSESLNTSISNCQAMLPATGAPVARQRTGRVEELYRDYVRTRTIEDWRFWVFSLLVEPLITTFNSSVSTASLQELYRTTLLWVDQHCSLGELRPAVLNALRRLSTSTDILTNPERLPEEAMNAVGGNNNNNTTQ